VNYEDVRRRIESLSMPEPNTGCWLWTATTSPPKWYGTISINGLTRRAHRVAYEAFVGVLPATLDVLHSCDTPQCVNPEHLSLGTQLDNMRDMRRKGRASYKCRLRKPDAVAIRHLRLMGHTCEELGEAYGVTKSTISKICLGRRSWLP